jgi:ABC-type lipoprotein release transport system permease subunit
MNFERLRFALLNLSRELSLHINILLLSILLIFFLTSILFVSSSLQKALSSGLEAEPDFVVQKIQASKIVPIKTNIFGELIEIPGTTHISARIWGRYNIAQTKHTVLLMGIDFLGEQGHDALEELIEDTNLNSFLRNRKHMIVGDGVLKWMKENEYDKTLNFFTPHGDRVELKYFATFAKKSTLFSNDIVLTDIKTARKILGYKRNEVTDFTFDVPNELEWEIIPIKVAALDYNLRIVSKKQSAKAYEELFNYNSGFFLLSFLIALVAFMMVLYQRYTNMHSAEKKHIGVLRAIGWGVGDLLAIKFYETVVILLSAYGIGVSLAWINVYILKAPLLSKIFLSQANFDITAYYNPSFDIFELVSIFLLFGVPFIAVVLIPVWKISTTTPKEAMR